MEKILVGVVFGVAAAIWVAMYNWVGSPHAQALMIFISIISGVKAASEREQEAH
ncbi:hypothetical protein KFE80_08890 [bacterium SCSIO 12696]|nr:hypothetical protein KFE80_08890 [bacterium SCSIO 12696]